jgi:hypothetical protein
MYLREGSNKQLRTTNSQLHPTILEAVSLELCPSLVAVSIMSLSHSLETLQ